MRLDILALLAGASAVLAVPVLEERQNDPDYGNTWDDPVTSRPRNFEVRQAGGPCEFQLVYEQDVAAWYYDLSYVAEYADGTYTGKPVLGGRIATDNVWYTRALPEQLGIRTVFFPDACTNGKVPVSFRARFALQDGLFTFKNRYTTPSIRVSSGTLPPAPQNVRIQNTNRPSTVSWSPVADATSYVVVFELKTDSEVGVVSVYSSREAIGGSTTSVTIDSTVYSATVVALYGGTIASGAKRFTPLDNVRDAYP